MMLPWIIVAVLYVLGASLMALLCFEWGYRFTLRPLAVIAFWPVPAAAALIGGLWP